MEQIVLVISIIFASIAVTTLGCVWMGTSYYRKLNGLTKGATQSEMSELQQRVKGMQQEVVVLKEEVQRLIRVAKGADE
jgi:peptidoglycan hydrolase CwlO-like protein